MRDQDKTVSELAGRPVLSEIEITPEMIEAGVKAADLLLFEWGEDSSESLVSRVYRAMYAARQEHL